MAKILIAVAWPYANGPRHIGHVAGFGVPSDIFARYQRLIGNEVLMVSGTDEHGTPITVQAEAEGIEPQELVDRYNHMIVEDLVNLGLSYDLFTRTTTVNHRQITQDIFTTLWKKSKITQKTSLGAFSRVNDRTLPDRYIEGTCPHCGDSGARGDQCDSCGKQIDPHELINPVSRVDGQPPVFKDTEHFFLRLDKFKDQLAGWLATKEDFWRPSVIRFSINLLKDLHERAITRDMEWGVPVPASAEYSETEMKRIYVWFDAVIGYLSATVEWAEASGGDWREWWQDEAVEHYYFMGKDNILFHSIIWPSILMGYGNGRDGKGLAQGKGGNLCLPYKIVASEFLTMEGKKFSSSRGVAIYVRDFLKRYHPDALRYYLTIAGPETQDTDFTWAEFLRRNNEELVATWGNLVNRALKFAYKQFQAVPEPGQFEQSDQDLLNTIEAGFATVGNLYAKTQFKAALQTIMELVAGVNRYTNDQAPWQTIKSDRERTKTIVFTILRAIDSLKVMLAPILPFSSEQLHKILGYSQPLSSYPQAEQSQHGHLIIRSHHEGTQSYWKPSQLKPNIPLTEPQALFPKLEQQMVEEELQRMEQS